MATEFVRGAEKLGRRLRSIQASIGLAPLVDEIGVALLRRTLDRFDNELDPDGRRWAELKESTIRRRNSAGYGGKTILKRNETLRNSIKIIRGGTGTTFFNTGAGLRIGVAEPDVALYGAIQNKGNGRIVARRFLGIGALDIKSVDSLMRRKAKQLEQA